MILNNKNLIRFVVVLLFLSLSTGFFQIAPIIAETQKDDNVITNKNTDKIESYIDNKIDEKIKAEKFWKPFLDAIPGILVAFSALTAVLASALAVSISRNFLTDKKARSFLSGMEKTKEETKDIARRVKQMHASIYTDGYLKDLINPSTDEGAEKNRRVAVDYIGEIGNQVHLEFLDKAAEITESDEILQAIKEAKLKIENREKTVDKDDLDLNGN